MNLTVSTQTTAQFFGVSVMAISHWRERGCPQISRGKYDLFDVFTWWQDNIMSAKVDASNSDMSKARTDYWAEKAIRERIAREREEKSLVPRVDIAKEWAVRLGEVGSGLKMWPLRLPPLLEGKQVQDMRKIIDKEVWDMLDNYQRTGRFCPKIDEIVKEKGDGERKRKRPKKAAGKKAGAARGKRK